MSMNRRQFLGLVAAAAATTGLPREVIAQTLLARDEAARAAAELTTLAQRLGPGPADDAGWRPVVTINGEPHLVRDELAEPQQGREGRRRSLLHFLHLTDQHIVDVQNTTRAEFLDRYSNQQCPDPLTSAHRPGEAACARIADAMLRRARRIEVSPVTGAPLAAAVCTGDNTDDMKSNELDIQLAVMNGGPVTPQSGDPDTYEGVQRSGMADYWHPDDAELPDTYKNAGFPVAPGWLDDALAPFDAIGAGVPWYSCYGNHDGLAQGNSPVTPAFEAVAAGPLKMVGAPPGANPCDVGEHIGVAPGAPAMEVTPDPEGRRYLPRGEWIGRHLDSHGAPHGHGFTQQNVDDELAYWAADVGPLRWIGLDTVNPGGFASGSVGDAQLSWLDEQLAQAEQEQRLVVLFSHHGPRSLDNPVDTHDPMREPDYSDLPRHQAGSVLDVVTRYTSVIAWVNGHTHNNVIESQRGPDEDHPGRFWDIGTAAHIDWPAQARLVEVVDNRDGTLSVFTTSVDHEDGPIVSFGREVIANDIQKGFGRGEGGEEDRNTELLIAHPFPAAQPPSEIPAADPADPLAGPPVQPAPALPATGLPAGLTVGGALLLAGAWGVTRLHAHAHAHELARTRPPAPPRESMDPWILVVARPTAGRGAGAARRAPARLPRCPDSPRPSPGA